MKTVTLGEKEYVIYTEDEAKDRGFGYVYFRDAKPDSKYLLTDDGWVVPVLSVYKMPDRDIHIYRTPIGHVSHYKKLFRIPENGYEKHNAFWKGEAVPKHRVTHRKRLFVYWYLRTGDEREAFRRAYPNRQVNTKAITYLLGQKEVREYMESKFSDVLAELGIDQKWVLKKYKEIVESKEPGSTKVTVLKELSEMLGMKTKVTQEKAAGVVLDENEMKALDQQKRLSLSGSSADEVDYTVVGEEDDEGKGNSRAEETAEDVSETGS